MEEANSLYVRQQVIVEGAHQNDIILSLAGSRTCIDFNKLIPMPSELLLPNEPEGYMWLATFADEDEFGMYRWMKRLNISSPEEFAAYVAHEYPHGIDLGKKYLANYIRYGCPTWHEWSVQNWGTKWNALGVHLWHDGPVGIVNYFKTVQSPAIPVFRKLSSLYHQTPITLRYFDEGMRFAGEAFFQAGVQIDKKFAPKKNDPDTQRLYSGVFRANDIH